MADSDAPATTDTPLKRRLRHGAIVCGVLLVGVYAILVVSAGGIKLITSMVAIKPWLLALPVIATLLSYVTMSLSYQGIARAAGSVFGGRDMLRITFVANTANYVLPSGGFSGFALRLVMFTKRGVTAGRAVLISFTQTLLTNLMLVVFIVYGLANLIYSQRVDSGSLIAATVLIGVLGAFLVSSLLMFYHARFRGMVLGWTVRLIDKLLSFTSHHERFSHRVHRMFAHVGEGMEFFASKPRAMVGPLFWIFLDWLLTIGVLYAAFYSVGIPLAFSQVAVGFSVGIVLAIISFVPGGVGVLEVSMAAAFASMGVPLKESVLPVFIFRVSFYVVPALISLVLARGAFADVDVAETLAAEEML